MLLYCDWLLKGLKGVVTEEMGNTWKWIFESVNCIQFCIRCFKDWLASASYFTHGYPLQGEGSTNCQLQHCYKTVWNAVAESAAAIHTIISSYCEMLLTNACDISSADLLSQCCVVFHNAIFQSGLDNVQVPEWELNELLLHSTEILVSEVVICNNVKYFEYF